MEVRECEVLLNLKVSAICSMPGKAPGRMCASDSAKRSYVSYVDFLCALCMCRDVGFFLWNQLCESNPGSVDYEGRLQDIVGMVGYAVLCIFMVQTFLLQQPLFVLNSAVSISHLRSIFF